MPRWPVSVRIYPDVKSRTSTTPVPLRLVVRRHRTHWLSVYLPMRVKPRNWSAAKQKQKPSAPGATEVNAALEALRTSVEAMLVGGADDETIRAALLERFGRLGDTEVEQAPASILERYAAFSRQKAAHTRKSTQQTYAALEKHLRAFLEERGEAEAEPSEIGSGFLNDFVAFAAGSGFSNGTVNKLLTRLRGFLTWLHDLGEIERVPKAKRLPTQRNSALYLTTKELAAFEALGFDGETAEGEAWTEGHRAARDLFLVGATTGQRFGDVAAMGWQHVRGLEHLEDDGDAELTWLLQSRKVGLVTRVPLVGPARRIVAARYQVGETTPVPRLSNQVANKRLKDLGRAARLEEPVTTVKNVGGERMETTRPKWECLTTHAARRTFVTLVLQSGAAPTELLGLTHSDLRTLQLYVGADEKRRRGRMTGTFGETSENDGS